MFAIFWGKGGMERGRGGRGEGKGGGGGAKGRKEGKERSWPSTGGGSSFLPKPHHPSLIYLYIYIYVCIYLFIPIIPPIPYQNHHLTYPPMLRFVLDFGDAIIIIMGIHHDTCGTSPMTLWRAALVWSELLQWQVA